jgi:hypothetical protein
MTTRFFRDGFDPACGTSKSFPGVLGGSFYYHVQMFTNTSSSAACVTMVLSSPTCDVQAGAYINSFNPLDLSTNYLADSGASTGDSSPQICSFSVPAGAKFLVVVDDLSGGSCTNYTMQLSGLPCGAPMLIAQPAGGPAVHLFWSTAAGGYVLEGTPTLTSPSWSAITNQPIVSGGAYNVTNSTLVPVDRFYRLHKP